MTEKTSTETLDIVIGIIAWSVILLLIFLYYKRKKRKKGAGNKKINKASELYNNDQFHEAFELIKDIDLEGKDEWLLYSAILSANDKFDTLLKVNYRIIQTYDLSTYEAEQICERNFFVFYHKGQFEKAIKQFQSLDSEELKEDAKIIESNIIFYLAGLCFKKINEPKIALETFKKADLSLTKNYDKTREILIEMANCNLKLKRKKTAIDQYQKAQSIKFDKKLSDFLQKIVEK